MVSVCVLHGCMGADALSGTHGDLSLGKDSRKALNFLTTPSGDIPTHPPGGAYGQLGHQLWHPVVEGQEVLCEFVYL